MKKFIVGLATAAAMAVGTLVGTGQASAVEPLQWWRVDEPSGQAIGWLAATDNDGGVWALFRTGGVYVVVLAHKHVRVGAPDGLWRNLGTLESTGKIDARNTWRLPRYGVSKFRVCRLGVPTATLYGVRNKKICGGELIFHRGSGGRMNSGVDGGGRTNSGVDGGQNNSNY